MRFWATFAVLSLVLVIAVVFLRPDLRGWTPADLGDRTALIVPTVPGKPGFTLAQCLPGSVDPYDVPRAGEQTGSATLSVLSCRSRSSAATILAAYAAVAFGGLFALSRLRRRRANA